MTDANKRMNPLHFGIDCADTQIPINPEIRIRILGHFCLRQTKFKEVHLALADVCCLWFKKKISTWFLQSPDYITDSLQPVAATSSRSSLRDACRGDYVVPRTNRKTADRAFSTPCMEPAADWTEKNTIDICLSPRTENAPFQPCILLRITHDIMTM